jgi:hypothetical protein
MWRIPIGKSVITPLANSLQAYIRQPQNIKKAHVGQL